MQCTHIIKLSYYTPYTYTMLSVIISQGGGRGEGWQGWKKRACPSMSAQTLSIIRVQIMGHYTEEMKTKKKFKSTPIPKYCSSISILFLYNTT